MPSHDHQVVIVGGGITGLTMALMLQNLGIDYVLLEAYPSVTPQHGASIGLYANGLRILDQLGLFEEVQKVAITTKVSVWRDSTNKGKRMMTREATPVLLERHGYGNMFMSRHSLLCVLEGGIKEKHRLLVNKRVCKIDSDEECAKVYTEDGDVYHGQLVVGADGVRSFVRKEMWRHAQEQEDARKQRQEPETSASSSDNDEKAADVKTRPAKKTKPAKSTYTIPESDKADIPCEHACIFGTAKPKPGITPGSLLAACGPRSTAGLMGAPNGDIYFFWFWTLPSPRNKCPIDDIPRITEEEKTAQLEACKDVIVTDDGLTMGGVLAEGEVRFSGVTALPHFVLDKWHVPRVPAVVANEEKGIAATDAEGGSRLVIIGDAAHKFNPLVGQGGNSCIESCATLVNALQEHVLPQTSTTAVAPSSTWSIDALSTAFLATETTRIPRVKEMVDRCQDAMRRVAWETWMAKALQRYVAPLLPLAKISDFYSWFITPGVRLYGDKFTPPPENKHTIPWDDEKAGYKGVMGARSPAAAVVAA